MPGVYAELLAKKSIKHLYLVLWAHIFIKKIRSNNAVKWHSTSNVYFRCVIFTFIFHNQWQEFFGCLDPSIKIFEQFLMYWDFLSFETRFRMHQMKILLAVSSVGKSLYCFCNFSSNQWHWLKFCLLDYNSYFDLWTWTWHFRIPPKNILLDIMYNRFVLRS